MKTGFEVLREVMVAGYKPSVARLYDPEDGASTSPTSPQPDDCVLLFMAEGAAGIAKATAEGIAEIVARSSRSAQPVDEPAHRRRGSTISCGGPTRSPARTSGSARPATSTAPPRSPPTGARSTTSTRRPSRASGARFRDITMLGGHSSHSYINGTNMYFNYFYDLVDCEPEEETDEVLPPDHLRSSARRRSASAARSSTTTASARRAPLGSRTSTDPRTSCSRR